MLRPYVRNIHYTSGMAHVTVSRLIHAPQADVWAVVSDIANARKWNKSWRKIEFTSPQTHGVGTTFRASMGGDSDSYEFEVCDWSAPDRIAFCPVIAPDEGNYSMALESHVFELRPADDGTLVELTANASAHGIRGRLIATFFWPGHQKDGLNGALEALSGIFEPDEDESEDNPAPDALTG
jgi:uncharacterized protein YndB with AHSA1/START domain